MRLHFDPGTIVAIDPHLGLDLAEVAGFQWDARVQAYRAPAFAYPAIKTRLVRRDIPFSDAVRSSGPQPSGWSSIELRPYQEAALHAWELGRCVDLLHHLVGRRPAEVPFLLLEHHLEIGTLRVADPNLRCFDGHPASAPSRLLVDDDPNVSMKRREKPHEALDGDVVEATTVHLRDLGLLDTEHACCLRFCQLPFLEDLDDASRELGLCNELLRGLKTEVLEDVPASNSTFARVLACATVCYMKRLTERVGIRELRQHLSVHLRKVAGGRTLEVTEHGRSVAVLAPLPRPESLVARLVAADRATQPDGDLMDLRPPKGRPSRRLTTALQALRADHR